MPTQSPHIILVDPVFRASRLAYTVYAIRACQGRFQKIHVICRKEYDSELYAPLTRNLEFELHPVVDLDKDFWYGSMPDSALEQVEEQVGKLCRDHPVQTVWFSGLDEFNDAFRRRLSGGGQLKFKDLAVGGVLYDARFMLRRRAYIPNLSRLDGLRRFRDRLLGRPQRDGLYEILSLIRTIARQCGSLRIALLDERIRNRRLRRFTLREPFDLFWLPDPGPAVDPEAKSSSVKTSQPLRILIVGTQTRRKGLHSIVDLIRLFGADLNHLQFHLFGRLSLDTEELRPFIESSPLFFFQEGFFSEAELINAYRSADYVIIPYDPSFHGSSGVLAHAMALGKPVVSSAHGLIGYRVKNRGLGLTYTDGNLQELMGCLRQLPRPNSEQYRLWEENARLSAREFSEENHIAMLQKIPFNRP